MDLFKKYASKLKIHPSNRSLIINAFNIIIYFFIPLVFLQFFLVTINRSIEGLAVFSGAIVLAIGFSIRPVTSNFISGVVLLFEKSIQVGDLLQVDETTFGYVRNTGAVYTLVEALDGRELLVPNETFITSKIVNWTHSSKKARVEMTFTLPYDVDLDFVRPIIVEAADKHLLCSRKHPIRFLVRKFTDLGIEVSLDFWVEDITTGRDLVRSEVMTNVCRDLKQNGIYFPIPKRNIYQMSGKD